MKTFLPLSRISILLSVLMTASAVAQVGRTPVGSYFGEPVPGAEISGPQEASNSPQHFMTRISPAFPGNLWFGYTGASEGLGFDTGGYFTVGAKTRLGTDLLDGRWLLEARGHLAHEQGNVFGNLGIERIFTITPAKTDVGFNFFVDADGDSSQNFGNNFWAVGVGGFLRHEKFELRGNGYIPIATTGYRLGDEQNCFFENFIIDQDGIDTALSGFDVEVALRPWRFQMLQGEIGVGGYYYYDPDRDVTGVDSFGGVRVRGRVTTLKGISVEAEYNYDDRLKATVIGRVVVSTAIFGQYGPRGRDLDRTIRNDHIVRFHQDVTFLINPATGEPYFVNHVDNTAAPGGDGTFARPFDELADVDPTQGGSSRPDDIIFVREGDGTFRNYDRGIALQDRQLLLGDGSRYTIPATGGREFLLCTDMDGNKPVLTNVTGGPVITLADDNFVAGLTLTGDNGVIKSSDGIFGALSRNGVTIRNMMISEMADDGIDINVLGGDVEIVNNMISDVDDEGISLGPVVFGTGRTIDVSENMIDDTGLDLDVGAGEQGHGISLTTVTAGMTLFRFADNTLSDIGGDAIRIDEVTGAGSNFWEFSRNDIDVTGTAANSSGGEGIFVNNVAGTGDMFMFFENDVREAALNGIFVNDITDDTSSAIYIFRDNTASLNEMDGIRLTNFDGASVLVERTMDLGATDMMTGMLLDPGLALTPPAPILFTTSQNGENGVHIAKYRNVLRETDPTAPGLQLEIKKHIADRNTGNGILLESIDGNAEILGVGEDVTITDPMTMMSMDFEFGITNNLTNGILIRDFTNSLLGASIDVRPLVEVDPMDPTMTIVADSIISGNDGIDTSAIRVELIDGQTPPHARASTLSTRITTRLNVTESIFDGNGGGITARVTGKDNELQVTMNDMKRINNHRNDIVDFDVLNGASGKLTVRDNEMMVDNNRGAGDFLDLNVDSGLDTAGNPGPLTTLDVTARNNLLTTTDVPMGFTPGDMLPMGTDPSIGGAGLRVNVNNLASLDVTFTDNSFDGLGNFGVTLSYSVVDDLTDDPPVEPINTFIIEKNLFNTPLVGDGLRLRTAEQSRVAGTFASNRIFDVTDAKGINIDAEDESTLRVQVLDHTLEDRNRDPMDLMTTAALLADPGESEDGIFVRSRNEATLLARIFGNRVINFGGAGNLTVTNGGPNPGWGRGIDVIKDDGSTFNVLIEKNSVTGSALEGLRVLSTQNNMPIHPTLRESGGMMTALVFDNSLLMNDVADPTDAVKFDESQDFLGESENDSDLCLTLHGNSSSYGYVVGSVTPPTMFRLEEGSNDLDTRQNVQRPDGTPQMLEPPTVEVIYTTPAASICVNGDDATDRPGYNDEVNRLEGVFGEIAPDYPDFP